MCMRIVFSILLLILINPIYIGASISDTSLVIKYYEASEREMEIYNFKTAKLYNDSALLASKFFKDNRYLGKLYQQKGIVLKKLQNYDSALVYLDISLDLGQKEINNQPFLAESYYNIGTIYVKNAQKEQAFINLDSAISLYTQIDNISGVCKSIMAKGVVYTNMRVYDTALVYYIESLELASDNNIEKVKIQTLINIANIYIRSDEYKKARKIFDDAYEICNQINDSVNKATIRINRAVTFLLEGDNDRALEGFKLALIDAIRVNDKSTIGLLNTNIAIIYTGKKEYDLALKYLYEAVEVFEDIGNSDKIATTYLTLGNVFKGMKEYSLSLEHYQLAVKYSSEVNQKQTKLKAFRSISILFEKQNDFENAYLFLDKHKTLRDTIFEDKKIKYLSEYQAKFNKFEDEAKILKLENEQVKSNALAARLNYQRNIYLGLVLFALLVIISIVLFFRWKSKKNKLISEQKLKQLESERKLANANSVLAGEEKERKRIAQELHDGIGVLLSTASIHFSNVEDKADKGISEMTRKAKLLLDKASTEIRHISHNMMPGVLSKFGIYEALTDVFEEIDEDTEINTSFNIEGEQKVLDENTEIMIYRIVQEMVNNTIKHSGASEVLCSILNKNDILSIVYSDNGSGFDITKTESKNSFGLNGIQSRVDFLEGKVQLVSETGKGTKYFIEIPI